MTDDPFHAPATVEGSRPASPQSAASVRSQAVAKLRRAASLPRKPIPRWPSNNNTRDGEGLDPGVGSSDHQYGAGSSGHRQQEYPQQRQFEDAQEQEQEQEPAYPSIATPHMQQQANGQSYGQGHGHGHGQEQYGYGYAADAGQEEMLSPSPVPDQYPYPYMSRSASSSSLHPTPPHLLPMAYNNHHQHSSQIGTPYDSTASSSTSASPHPDWTMAVPTPYMPQLSPAHLGHSPYMNPGVGRNTPSPLPSLGELRSISRSNSTAARARAMDKLTGGGGGGGGNSGRETPIAPTPVPMTGSASSTAPPLSPETPTRPGLQRADSLGARTHAPLAVAGAAAAAAAADLRAANPPSAFLEPRPRLQRSFTVSSSNMGVERRSAVGRRMVARLAERAADKQAEVEEQEAEVRRLWEARTGRVELEADGDADRGVEGGEDVEVHDHAGMGWTDGANGGATTALDAPIVVRHSADSIAADPIEHEHDQLQAHNCLMPPQDDRDRPGSRNTQMSDTDAFEYASHLSRSQSTRTARNMPVTPEKQAGGYLGPDAEVAEHAEYPEYADEEAEETLAQSPVVEEEPGHRDSAGGDVQGSSGTAPAEYGNGDGLQSMMFMVGDRQHSGSGMRQISSGVPISVDDQGGEWDTSRQESASLRLPRSGTDSIRTPSNHSNRSQHSHSNPSELSHSAYDGNLPYNSQHSQQTHHSHSHPHSHSQSHSQSRQSRDQEYEQEQEQDLTPPGMSTRTSVMSWEEVATDNDRTMPTDETYNRKFGSIGAKMGSAVRAMRKRSQSRSSTGSGPTSPSAGTSLGAGHGYASGVGARPLQEALSIAVQGFSRRGSEASVSPVSGRSLGRAQGQAQAQTHGRAPSEQTHIRHQPSMSSLSPSLHTSTETSTANSILLQHQLTNDPQSRHEMPRARPDDPRVFNSKLSPFPGVERASLSAQSTGAADAPRLIHQHSDSVVPTHTHTAGKSVEIHALPLVTPPEEHIHRFHSTSQSQPSPTKRSSTDSKRGWFAKTLASATSPRSPRSSHRSSATPSRKASAADLRDAAQVQASTHASQALAAALEAAPRPKTSAPSQAQSHPHSQAEVQENRRPTFALPENDIFGAALQPPPSAAANAKNARSRPISPSVSTVAELNEDGHRLTQFTAFRSANQTPVMEEELLPSASGHEHEHGHEHEYGMTSSPSPYASRDTGMLRKMGAILELETDDPERPDVLDDPPRKLLLAMQVLLVVAENAAKDRYLLLFNDILVICKPILPSTHSGQVSLDMPFIVKSVVPLDRLQVHGLENGHSSSVPNDRNADDFAHRFARDPFGACLDESDNARLAYRLISTLALDPVSMGTLLSHSTSADLLSAFIKALRLRESSLVDALRVFLLAVSLPEDQAAGDNLLDGFARGWHAANQPSYGADMAVELVHALIHLSDEIHGNRFGFALRNPSISAQAFLSSFRARDPSTSVNESALQKMYRAVETAPIMPPLPLGDASSREIVVSGMPKRLEYDTWSDDVFVRIADADSDLCITLQGEGLEFEPNFLDFRQSGQQAFRVRGTGVGGKSVLMVRQGLHAPLYNNLPAAHPIQIDRAYMSHTFHLSFLAPTGEKRRYCIALPDAQSRSKWAMLLPRQINRCRTMAAQHSIEAESGAEDVSRRIAADALGLEVLRDALVRPVVSVSESGGGVDGGERRGSVSTTYGTGAGRAEEASLGPLYLASGTGRGTATAVKNVNGHGEKGAPRPLSSMTGKEVVLICRQNSILPDMLDILQQPGYANGHGINSDDGNPRAEAKQAGAAETQADAETEAEQRERLYEAESRAQSRAAGRF